jgi:hypothetical protein
MRDNHFAKTAQKASNHFLNSYNSIITAAKSAIDINNCYAAITAVSLNAIGKLYSPTESVVKKVCSAISAGYTIYNAISGLITKPEKIVDGLIDASEEFSMGAQAAGTAMFMGFELAINEVFELTSPILAPKYVPQSFAGSSCTSNPTMTINSELLLGESSQGF